MLIKKDTLQPEELTKIRRDLTLKPFQCKGFTRSVETFTVYEEDEDTIRVPRFWAHNVLKHEFVLPKSPDFVMGDDCFKGSLRTKQEEIIATVLPRIRKEGGGILSVQCGQGKTVMAINILCQLRVKTLIIVNKQQLLQQWQERLLQFAPSLLIGTIQQDRVDIEGKPVVLGMLQSLSMREYPADVLSSFDFMIVDEVHNIATRTFSKCLMNVAPPYTLGLSATPKRPDGMSCVFLWFLGPMLFEAKDDTPRDVTVRMISYRDKHPKFREVYTMKGEVSLSTMISNISQLASRNQAILDVLCDILSCSPGRSVLILSSRIQQLQTLREGFVQRTGTSFKSSLYVGSMKAADLKEALVDSQILFGSYELICEGFDYPRLDTLIFATPRSRVEQAVGRILRKENPDQPPIVYDFVDELPSFKSQGLKRARFYKTKGYTIRQSHSGSKPSG